ncbi:MAG TPA: aldo/keto reductase [Gemmatimonadaceae bacterium]|nr:aldo/keto reductase [Gemmatimonadaceae bacterium]
MTASSETDAPRVERRALGASGLEVPVVGMGTWRTFDVHGSREEARCREVLDVAYAVGATLFDTSPMYGEAERVLAAAMGDRREDALVADKLWTPDDAEAERQAERALRWYGGRVDVYQVHNLVGLRRRLALLERLRDEGKVRVIGATHYQHSAYPELLALVRSGTVQQIQIPYNARDRLAERELLPAAADHGVGVIVMRPLGEGALARHAPSAETLAPLAAYGVRTWAQALLKFILSDARVSCVIPATSRPERMAENALAGSAPWFDSAAREYVAGLV